MRDHLGRQRRRETVSIRLALRSLAALLAWVLVCPPVPAGAATTEVMETLTADYLEEGFVPEILTAPVTVLRITGRPGKKVGDQQRAVVRVKLVNGSGDDQKVRLEVELVDGDGTVLGALEQNGGIDSNELEEWSFKFLLDSVAVGKIDALTLEIASRPD